MMDYCPRQNTSVMFLFPNISMLLYSPSLTSKWMIRFPQRDIFARLLSSTFPIIMTRTSRQHRQSLCICLFYVMSPYKSNRISLGTKMPYQFTTTTLTCLFIIVFRNSQSLLTKHRIVTVPIKRLWLSYLYLELTIDNNNGNTAAKFVK